jgi:hypothetical protein
MEEFGINTAAGVVRYATGGDDSVTEGKSVYLGTLAAPDCYSSNIPDDNRAQSVLKSVQVNEVIQVGDTGSFLLVIPWSSPRRDIRMYVLSPVDGFFHYYTTIEDAEDLSETFRLVRNISSVIKVQGSSVTGNTFEVSGSIVAVTYQDLPAVSALTYETVASYATDPKSGVSSVPIYEGVACVAQPFENHEFYIPGTSNSGNVEKALFIETVQERIGGSPTNPQPGWSYGGTAQTEVIFDSTLAPGFIPDNLWGESSLLLQVTVSDSGPGNNQKVPLTVVTGPLITDTIDIDTELSGGLLIDYPTLGQAQLIVEYDQVDIDGNPIALQSIENIFYTVPYRYAPVTLSATFPIYQDAPITSITLTLFGANNLSTPYLYNPVGSDEPNTDVSNFIALRSDEYYSRGYKFPGTLIAVKGLGGGQQVVVSGVKNYEVCPDAELSKNLPVTREQRFNPLDLALAEETVTSPTSPLRFCYTLPDYEFMKRQVLPDLMERRIHQKHASGFGRKLLTSLAKAGKTLVSEFIPSMSSSMQPTVQQHQVSFQNRANAATYGSGQEMAAGVVRYTGRKAAGGARDQPPTLTAIEWEKLSAEYQQKAKENLHAIPIDPNPTNDLVQAFLKLLSQGKGPIAKAVRGAVKPQYMKPPSKRRLRGLRAIVVPSILPLWARRRVVRRIRFIE